MHRWVVVLVVLVLVGCQSLRPTPLVGVGSPDQPTTVQSLSDASVQGRVDFGGRTTQATPADVVNSATVSFIDTGTNQTVATGKTDAAGSFTLTLGTYTPVNGGTYLLEAVKGLNAQAPGSDAARFRTVLRWNGTGWQSCTNSTVPGSIVINSLTTALAIETALDPANVPASNTIGKVNVGTNPATLNPTPGPYTNHPDSEIAQLSADLLSYLGADTDPLASVPAISPSLSSFQPTSAGANSLVRIAGSGFSPVPSGNTVTFNGIGAQVLVATPTSLVVVVPAGASTGTLRVMTARGSVDSGTPFTVSTSGASGLVITGFSPTLGLADTVVSLSGSFGTGTATPSVTFSGPSSVPVSAQVSAWTSTSMTVVVPVGAVPGSIAVQSGASTATSPGSFEVRAGNLSWMENLTPTSTSSVTGYTLPQTLYGTGCATWGTPARYYYVSGGSNGTTSTREVWLYQINDDGTLRPARLAGRMNTVRHYHAAAVWGNYLYVFGGYSHPLSVTIASIERAPINVDGSLGTFQTLTVALSVPRRDMQALVSGNNIYVLNGYQDTTGRLSTHDRFTVNPANGDLTLTTTTNTLIGGVSVAMDYYGAVISGNYIVGTVGYVNGALSPKSFVLPIGGDGALGNGTYGPDLNKSYYGAAVAIINNEIYALSGQEASGPFHYSVAHAPFNPATGTLGAWVYDSPGMLAPSVYVQSPLVVGNRLYTFGGYGNLGTGALSNGAHALIQSATVKADKSLSRWALCGGVPMPVYGPQGTLIGNKMWSLGGYSYLAGGATRETYYYVLQEDGMVGAATPGPLLNYPTHGGTCFTANGYVYVTSAYGGRTTVERAAINPDGTLGAFVVLPVQQTVSRNWPAGIRVGKYYYLIGGYTDATGQYQDTIERAELFADGSLGSFERLNTRLPGPTYTGNAEVVGNYVYVAQGHTGSAYSAAVFMARIEPDGTLGQFIPAPSLPASMYTATMARIGNYLYNFGGWDGAVVTATYRALINPDGTLNSWSLYRVSGRDILPAGIGHLNTRPYVYRNHFYFLSGYNSGSNLNMGSNNSNGNVDWILKGTIN